MKKIEKFHENMCNFWETLCWEFWICPFCGSNKVAETWEILEGRFRNGDPYGPFGGIDEWSIWTCIDCGDNWERYEGIGILELWREWKHKGKMIKI